MKVTELSPELIKSNLIEFLRDQPEFEGYDFAGDTMNILLGVLAYNTYYNNFYLNMFGNEQFLDTAQRRYNLVSLAKPLGYVPRSPRSSVIKAIVEATGSIPVDAQLKIRRGSRFQAVVKNTRYDFVNMEDVVLNTPFNTELTLYEGTLGRYTYTDINNIIIPIQGVDVDSILMEIYDSSVSTNKVIYEKSDTIINVTKDSKVYFVEEIDNQNIKLYFGDNIIGKKPSVGNVVVVTFRVTTGSSANSISKVQPMDPALDPETNVTYQLRVLSISQIASGGDDIEGLESIRLNAPRYFQIQDRLIVPDDYEAYILNKFPNIESVSAWGGETNDPPIYGKTFITIKPKDSYLLSLTEKEIILDDITKKSSMSIDPVIVDPTFVFIIPTIEQFYDSTTTSLSNAQLGSLIADEIVDYEESKMGIFKSQFNFTDFSSSLNSVNPSFRGNEINLKLEKRLVPIINSKMTYVLRFGNEFLHHYDGYISDLISTGFRTSLSSKTVYLKDKGDGVVALYTLDDNVYTFLSDIGTIDYDKGIINMNLVNIVDYEGDYIQFTITPRDKMIHSEKHQVILLSSPSIVVTDLSLNSNRIIYDDVNILGNKDLIILTGIKDNTVIT